MNALDEWARINQLQPRRRSWGLWVWLLLAFALLVFLSAVSR